jgi:hypothetical protein
MPFEPNFKDSWDLFAIYHVLGSCLVARRNNWRSQFPPPSGSWYLGVFYLSKGEYPAIHPVPSSILPFKQFRPRGIDDRENIARV